jgi:GNAT superfamily N-acetyltransferase
MGGSFVEDSISSKFITHNTDKFHDTLVALSDLDIISVWVAVTESDEIMGAVGVLITPNIYNSSEVLADIYFIDVVPKYRKRGLAKELMRVAEGYARERNAIAITVSFNQEKIADRVVRKGYTKYEYKLIKSLR